MSKEEAMWGNITYTTHHSTDLVRPCEHQIGKIQCHSALQLQADNQLDMNQLAYYKRLQSNRCYLLDLGFQLSHLCCSPFLLSFLLPDNQFFRHCFLHTITVLMSKDMSFRPLYIGPIPRSRPPRPLSWEEQQPSVSLASPLLPPEQNPQALRLSSSSALRSHCAASPLLRVLPSVATVQYITLYKRI